MTEKPRAFQDAVCGRKPIAMDLSREGAPVAFAPSDREGALWAMEGVSGWDAVDEVGRCLKEAGYGPYEIVRNRAECPLCGELVESWHRHDFRSCGCGNVSVDGGQDYLRRLWRDAPPIERSEIRWAFRPEG